LLANFVGSRGNKMAGGKFIGKKREDIVKNLDDVM
jgi:hypothetical protein